MWKTRITELLGIKYPIILGAMAYISESQLVASICHEGGTGVIASGGFSVDEVQRYIHEVRDMCGKQAVFGVNLMLQSPNKDDIAQLVCDEKVPFVTIGAGNASSYINPLHQAGIHALAIVPTVKLAERVQERGADAVIIEGMEAGGHIGKLTTMTLVRQVAAAVSIPVIAAGGIADGEGVAAGFMLGAEAVQVGTRFVVAKESNAHPKYKEKILKARDIDTTISAQHFGHAVRAIKNQLTRDFEQAEKDAFKQENPDLEIFEQMGAGALAKAVVHGDVEGGSVMAGQIAGLVSKEETVEEILKDLYYGAAKKIQEEASRWAGVVRND